MDVTAHPTVTTTNPANLRGHSTSDASLQRRLETSLERNRQLRDQVADLTRKLETAHGEIRRLRVLPGSQVGGASSSR
ncbi:hypothetical protein [Streptomyces atratus]|uniref:hypothetical protein n=1 Tax=Streptomyces atratus TaxID=1893 RepID=UPI003653C6F2